MNHLKAMAIAGSFLMLFSAGDAQAQLCGYGTSRQDCDNQNRDAQARSEAEQQHRRKAEAQGEAASNSGNYQGATNPSQPRAGYGYGYVAVAWHSDAADVWSTWNRTSEEEATTVALAACRRTMGEGCTIALSAWNSTVAVAKAPDGSLSVGWGAKPDEAAAKAMESCLQRLAGCTVKHSFTAKPWSVASDYIPRNAPRLIFVMIAWPKTAPAPNWQNKVWIASGPGGYAQASAQLLDRCKKDSGVECEIPLVASADSTAKGGGVVGSYYHPKLGSRWFASPSPDEAKAKVEHQCRKDGVTCESFITYDAFTRRLQTLDSPQAR